MKVTTEQIHKELDLIQDVIRRMANYSYRIKAAMIGIIGGVIAISENVIFSDNTKTLNEPAAFAISIFLVILVLVFWYMDAFFLQVEKKYREVYKWVVENRSKTDRYLYDLNTFVREIDGNKQDLTKSISGKVGLMFSKTLFFSYIAPFLFVTGLLVFQMMKLCGKG